MSKSNVSKSSVSHSAVPHGVEEIRQEIDVLDNKLHDLLMKRAELVIEIGKAKKKSKTPVVQPAREAMMLRRLLGRHKGLLPREAIVRIWRELVGAVSLLQTGLQVVVTVPDEKSLVYWDMAKDYFSSVLPMKTGNDALAVLSTIRDGETTIGVLPWPEDKEAKPWWLFLLEEQGNNPLRIMARLPFGNRTKATLSPDCMALAVARVNYGPSGEDRSFLILEIDSSISRSKIIDKTKDMGFPARNLYSDAGLDERYTRHLVEVEGYLSPDDDDRLKTLLEKLDCPEGRALCVGGYPVPPLYGDKVGKGAEEIEQQI